MPDPTLAYIAGTVVGLFIGAIAYAFLSSTSPEDEDIDIEPPTDTDDTDDTNAGVGPFALCAGCGRIAPRDEQMRLCPKCAPSPDTTADFVREREYKR